MALSRISSVFGTATTTTTAHRLFTASSATAIMYPRAAVAATIQWTCPRSNLHHYLLVQRKNPPDQGKWSCAGGKIELGESTLIAARREVQEETQIRGCRWHSNSFLTTDAIVVDDDPKSKNDNKNDHKYAFHYVIAHCFAKVTSVYSSGNPPVVVPSDDALDAKWYTLAELRDLECSEPTIEVIERAEELSGLGLLPV
jgi:ADP-ribose pyrophosphatase YjhB (NUDIX family)